MLVVPKIYIQIMSIADGSLKMQTKFSGGIVLLSLVLLISCTGLVRGLSDNPPAYIKDVHTDLRGPDSFVVYLTLRDNNMVDTISDGKAAIEIIQTPYMSYKGGPTVLFNQTRDVKKTDFNESPLGVMCYSFGPISNSQFGELNPMGANYAIVNIYFITPEDQVLSSQCDLPIPL
jgi:hypothetical protein